MAQTPFHSLTVQTLVAIFLRNVDDLRFAASLADFNSARSANSAVNEGNGDIAHKQMRNASFPVDIPFVNLQPFRARQGP